VVSDREDDNVVNGAERDVRDTPMRAIHQDSEDIGPHRLESPPHGFVSGGNQNRRPIDGNLGESVSHHNFETRGAIADRGRFARRGSDDRQLLQGDHHLAQSGLTDGDEIDADRGHRALCATAGKCGRDYTSARLGVVGESAGHGRRLVRLLVEPVLPCSIDRGLVDGTFGHPFGQTSQWIHGRERLWLTLGHGIAVHDDRD